MKWAQEAGDARSREILMGRHERLIWHIAWKHAGGALPVEDLFQEGAIGLMRAIDSYDPERNVSFGSYAALKITSQITHALRDQGSLIRRPVWVQDLLRRARDTQAELSRMGAKTQNIQEIAGRLGVESNKLTQLLDLEHCAATISLDAGASDEGMDNPVGERSVCEPKGMLRIDERIDLQRSMARLPEDEAMTIYLHIVEGHSLPEVSEKTGLSFASVRRKLHGGLHQLRSYLESDSGSQSKAGSHTA